MSRLFILIATLLISGLPVMAATGLSGVIFTNLNKRHFVVNLSAAPTNMIKLNLDTGQFDTGGTTITITNINSLFTNSVTFPPSFTTNYTNVFITVDTNGNLVPLGYDKTQFAVASSELHVKNSPRITNLFTLDDVTLGTMTYQWPLNGTNDGLLSIIAILPATGFDPYPKAVLKWLGSSNAPITNLYVLTNIVINNTNFTQTNLVVTNLFIMNTNYYNPTQFHYDPISDNIVNIKNQPNITNAILYQVLTIDGLAYNFPTQYQTNSLLYDGTGTGNLSWGGSLTNPISNIHFTNITVNGVSNFFGSDLWTNNSGSWEPTGGNSMLVTNLTSAQTLVGSGALVLSSGSIAGINLLFSGTNVINPYQQSTIYLVSTVTNGAIVTLDAGNGVGSLVFLVNVLSNSTFTLPTAALADDPTKNTYVRGNAWTPTESGESLLLLGVPGGWVEIGRANPNGPAPMDFSSLITTNYFLVGGTNITVVTTTSGTNVTFTVNSSVSATNQFTPALIDAQNFLVPISYVGVGASNGPSHSYMITYATNASRLLMHGVGTGGLASDAAIYTEPDGTTSFAISGPTSGMTWTPTAGITLTKSGGGEQIIFGSTNMLYHSGSSLFYTNSNNPSFTVANAAGDSVSLGLTGTTLGRVSASSFLELSGGTTTLIIHNSLNKIYPNTTGMDLGDTGHTLNGIYGQTNSVIYFGTNLLSTDGANHLTWNGVAITVP